MSKSISVKGRIFLYNITMILIPVILVIVIMILATTGLAAFLTSDNSRVTVWDSMGWFSVYRIQININDIEEQFRREVSNIDEEGMFGNLTDKIYNKLYGESGQVSSRVLRYCDEINATGSLLAIFINDELVYITPGNGLAEISGVFFDVLGSDDIYCEPTLASNASGTVITSFSYFSDGSSLRLVVANSAFTSVIGGTGNRAQSTLMEYTDNLIIAFVTLAVILILLSGLIFMLLERNSILKPLRLLQDAAREIRDGNLEHEITYRRDDEIGRLCNDFNEMRIRLKRSVEEQSEYEENRKLLIAGITHDIRTPLTTIKGYAAGLIDGIASTPEKRELYIKTIYNTAQDMESLVGDLSLFTRLESDSLPFSFEKRDAVEFVRSFLEEQRALFELNDVEVEFKNRCEAEAFVSIDPDQFSRVLFNIVENSIKYKKKDGTKCVISAAVRRSGDGDIIIKFADNGVGVSKDELPVIFDTFYRTDKARTNVSSGSGLGLSISRRIVQRHKGAIWAEESASKGLAMFILLPSAEK